jgi:hypothetical protein
VNGEYGKALSLDGENDYVDCGTLGGFGSIALGGAATYMCWIKSSQTASSFLLGTENDYPSTAMVIHTNTPEVDKVRVYLRDDSWNRLAADLTAPFDFTGTGWHHFAFIVDAEHAEIAIYIDGVPRAVTYHYKQSPFAFSDFQYPLYIGAHNMYGSIEYGPPMKPLPKVTFEGLIDEVKIYCRALTEEEIMDHYGVEISASVNFQPDTLNLNSKGSWISCYIELPESHSANSIDTSSIMLNNSIQVDPEASYQIGDWDNNGIPDLMTKFDRDEIIQFVLESIETSEHEPKASPYFIETRLKVKGELTDGTFFEGIDTVRIMFKFKFVS